MRIQTGTHECCITVYDRPASAGRSGTRTLAKRPSSAEPASGSDDTGAFGEGAGRSRATKAAVIATADTEDDMESQIEALYGAVHSIGNAFPLHVLAGPYTIPVHTSNSVPLRC